MVAEVPVPMDVPPQESAYQAQFVASYKYPDAMLKVVVPFGQSDKFPETTGTSGKSHPGWLLMLNTLSET